MKYMVVAAAMSAAACSPYAYQREVESFSSATIDLTEGLAAAQAGILSEPAKQAYWVAYTNPAARVALQETPCRANSAGPCYIQIDNEPYTIEPDEQDLLAAMAPLRTLAGYAKGLEAVTDASDRAAFDAASAELSASAGAFVGSVVPHPAAGPIASVSVRAGTTILGFFLDQARLSQLRATVSAVDAHFPQAEAKLAEALDQIRDKRVREIKRRLSPIEQSSLTGTPSFTRAERLTMLAAMQNGTAEISALQRSKPEELPAKLAAAHGALAEALANPKADPVEIAKTLAGFATLAADFKDAFAGQ